MTTECLLEGGYVDKNNGYRYARVDGRLRRLHRVVWERANGPIPDGVVICHRCDNPSCIELTHLFAGTQAQNLADMSAKSRSTAGRWLCGHPQDAENIYTGPDGRRRCRTCSRAYRRKYKEAQR